MACAKSKKEKSHAEHFCYNCKHYDNKYKTYEEICEECIINVGEAETKCNWEPEEGNNK